MLKLKDVENKNLTKIYFVGKLPNRNEMCFIMEECSYNLK